MMRVLKKLWTIIDDHYDQIFLDTYNYEATAEKLMKHNNTRLQYLLKLYSQRRSEQGIHYIYKSACRTYKYWNDFPPSQDYLYKILWTDIRDFFWPFHADFVSVFRKYFDSHLENSNNASKFCDDYFKWLSQKLSEKGKVSFEEVEGELKRLLQSAF